MSQSRRRQQSTMQSRSSDAARPGTGRDGQPMAGVSNAGQRRRIRGAAVGDDGPPLDAFGQAIEAEADSVEWAQVLSGNRILQLGARGTAVESLQEMLRTMGQNVRVDGHFGAGTDRAVRAVQRQLGLPADGMVGGNTARSLIGRPSQVAPGDRDRNLGRDTGPGAVSYTHLTLPTTPYV